MATEEEGFSAAFAPEEPEPVEAHRALATLETRLFGKSGNPLRVSRYTVRRRLGSGGFGSVYQAFDPELDREVAIKVLHSGRGKAAADTHARQRLLREAQAMARFSHPNVVAVHDVGTFPLADDPKRQGVFIVMEYIEGPTLAEWIRQKRRPWREVTRVFAAAGRGLAAAHTHGLVHRDFKPSNVMLGDDGRICVGDFGLARGTDDSSGHRVQDDDPESTEGVSDGSAGSSEDRPLDFTLTRPGTVMGTPTYMAPEQHRGTKKADARADQYAFCVALFEALYGRTPFSGSDLRELATAKERRPQLPDAPPVPARLRQALTRGLSPRADDRFPDMDSLLAVIDRDPGSRRRWGLAAGGVTIAAVAAVLAWSPQRVAVCDEAVAKLAGVWDDTVRAQGQSAFDATGLPYAAQTWQSVATHLDAYTESYLTLHRDACAATLERGEASVEAMGQRLLCLDRRLGRLGGLTRLLTDADARVVENASDAVQSLPPLERCTAIDGAHQTPAAQRDAILAAEAIIARADALERTKRSEVGRPLALEAIEAALASSDPVTIGRAYQVYARVSQSLGQLDEALAGAEEASRRADQAGDDELSANAALTLIRAFATLGRFEEAEQTIERERARAARDDDDPAQRAALLRAEGVLRLRQGRSDEAIATLQAVLDLDRSSLGPGHPVVAGDHNMLGAAYGQAARYLEAERHLTRAIELWEATLGGDHPYIGLASSNLGNVAESLGRYEDSLRHHTRGVDIVTRTMGPEAPEYGALRMELGSTLQRLGRWDEARAHFEAAAAQQEDIFGRDSAQWALVALNLSNALTNRGDLNGGLAMVRDALTICRRVYGDDHPLVVGAEAALAGSLAGLGRYDEALPAFEQAIASSERVLPDSITEALTRASYGEALVDAGRADEGLPHLNRAVQTAVASAGAQHPDTLSVRTQRAAALAETGDFEAAARELAEVVPARAEIVGADNPVLLGSYGELGRSLIRTGETQRGVAALERAHAIAKTAASPSDAAHSTFELARALVDEDAARARELARTALAGYEGLPGHEDQARAVSSWLRKHRARPR